MISTVLAIFLISHVLGDYYFQTNKLAVEKEMYLNKLCLHGIIYGMTMVVPVTFIYGLEVLSYSVLIAVIHFVIDYMKFKVARLIKADKYQVSIYIIDQLVHILTIFIVTGILLMNHAELSYSFIMDVVDKVIKVVGIDFNSVMVWGLAVLIIIKPSSITIKKLLYQFDKANNNTNETDGRKNAGRVIGVLERVLILIMVSQGQYAAIGLILAAKSVVRYKRFEEDLEFAEYYLIGTFLSTILVVITYLAIF